MKARHWINLIVVGSIAAAMTFFAYRWAVTSYAEPTCRQYAESQGLTYVSYTPPDWDSGTGTTHMSRDGNCQLTMSSGEAKTVSLVTASGLNFGAPFLVSFALRPDIIGIFSFMGVAFILASIGRIFKRSVSA